MHEELLIKVRNVLMLCDPAVRARMHPQANSLESQAFNLVGEINAALSAQPNVGSGGDAHDIEDPCDVITRAAQKLVAAGQPRIADRLVRARAEVERLQAAALATRQPVGQEPVEYQYRFWIEERDTWSGWAPMRKQDYERITKTPEEERQVRALYTAPPAAAPNVELMAKAIYMQWADYR